MRTGGFSGGLIEGILFLFVGAGLCALSVGFHDGGSIALSPALFPVIVTFMIAVFGVVIISQQLRKENRITDGTNASEDFTPTASNLKNMWLVFFLSLIYAFLLPHLHFIPASLLYLAVFFFLTGERRIPVLAILSAGTVGAVYVVFQKGLSVLLP